MNPAFQYFLIPLFPLLGALLAGLGGRWIGRSGAHTATILGVALATVGAAWTLIDQLGNAQPFNSNLYVWMTINGLDIPVGFLIDPLTALMMVVVCTVSLMVHVYTIGYMADDPGYSRFFSYISLFTFSMLMLVMSNNFVQLFFGWEAVGLVSYLLIGFWYQRPSAIFANLKAFMVNRVGDFGFLLGIGLVLAHFGSFYYADVFAQAPALKDATVALFSGVDWSLLTVICLLLFVGAMGKSAQFPLHVWLPDSMEGPTPISALIHAATMVTAGIFMVARMSPLFELSETALNAVMTIGAITALFMGFLGIIQNDIKRVVAYSTLSQLGYMTVALGASAYSVAIFHLATHAFFKALLFLAAGSVIIGMHHDQDIRHMGGLRRHMPITWITSLLGSLALIGTPFFSGFYSKDAIIHATHTSSLTMAPIAYWALLIGVFVTAFYSFRMYFLVFHGAERWRVLEQHHGHEGAHSEHHGLAPQDTPHESPLTITLPLVLLAIPSVVLGWFVVDRLLGEGTDNFLYRALDIAQQHPVMTALAEELTANGGATGMALHALTTAPFLLALAGVILAWVFYCFRPDLPAAIQARTHRLYRLLEQKYYMDHLYILGFAAWGRAAGEWLWRQVDTKLIDGTVNGAAWLAGAVAARIRRIQTGYVHHYALVMIIGLLLLLTLWIIPLFQASVAPGVPEILPAAAGPPPQVLVTEEAMAAQPEWHPEMMRPKAPVAPNDRLFAYNSAALVGDDDKHAEPIRLAQTWAEDAPPMRVEIGSHASTQGHRTPNPQPSRTRAS